MPTKEKQIQSGIPQLIQAIQSTGMYSVVLALVPILSIYYSGIPGLNLADVILALLWLPVLYFLLTKRLAFSHLSKSLDKPKIALLLFAAFCIALLLLQTLNRDLQLSDIAIRTTRIVFYLTTAMILTPLMFHRKTLFSVLKIVSVLAAAYLLIQVVVYRTSGGVILGYVPFWPLYSPEYANVDYVGSYAYYPRPTSFFLEPAHFSRYAGLGLAIVLFGSPGQKRRCNTLVAALFITLAVVMSTSSIGMIMVGFLWTVLVLDLIKEWLGKGQCRRIGLLLMCVLICLCTAYLFSPTIHFVLGRSFQFGPGSAFDGRLGSMRSLMNDPNLLNVFFGHGYGSVPGINTWMSGFTYITYGTGILGICLIIFALGTSFFQKGSSHLDRIMLSLFFILLLVDDSFNSVLVVLLYALALFGTRKAGKA